MSISIDKLKSELNRRVSISLKLKEECDFARTKTKRNYMFKRIRDNNKIIAKILVSLDRNEVPEESPSVDD